MRRDAALHLPHWQHLKATQHRATWTLKPASPQSIWPPPWHKRARDACARLSSIIAFIHLSRGVSSDDDEWDGGRWSVLANLPPTAQDHAVLSTEMARQIVAKHSFLQVAIPEGE
ncbi:hypothetical protein TcWFU_007201 [Taenia crassiceps]|uniref:Uncharacterized protein n=1 Tax=Taenia crassiceps TaxID=6207 RepID=A0ABR4QBI2_9CEST